ncbi:molybdopterin biosynthesis enzyme MoaB [Klebsiella variicola]|nr:molybdopterin biosynthesis enzyme MoaB [Klebsiella variicola]
MNTLRIGLVSISDRASSGVYQDKGIPALEEWLARALTTPFELQTRLIPDEQVIIEQTLCELVDEMWVPSGADHRRNRPCASRCDA